MNKYIYAIAVALAALLTACSKPVEEILTLSRSGYTTGPDAAKLSLNVTHSADYTLSIEDGADSWLSAEPNGAEKNMIVVSISENETYNERKGRVAVKMGSLTEYFTVTQGQKNAIVVSDTEFEMDCNACDFTVKLGSNVSYKVAIDATWISQKQTKAYQEENLVFTCEDNMGAEARTAYIKFTSGNLQQSVMVTQKGRVLDYLLYFKHNAASVTAPEIKGSIISGSINWGDGKEGLYVPYASHDYVSAQEYQVEMRLVGGIDKQTVIFKDIVGITEIDLSNL